MVLFLQSSIPVDKKNHSKEYCLKFNKRMNSTELIAKTRLQKIDSIRLVRVLCSLGYKLNFSKKTPIKLIFL